MAENLRRTMSNREVRAAQRTMTRLTRILAGDHSIGVRFAAGVPHTDGKTVVLNPAYDADPVLNRIAAEAIAAHEAAGHIRHTDFGAWMGMINEILAGTEDPVMRDMVNILEDARVNHLVAQQFPGSGDMMKVHHAHTYQRFLQMAKGDTSVQSHLAPGLIALASEVIAGGRNPYEGMNDEIDAFMDEVRPVCKGAIAQPNTSAIVEQARKVTEIYRKHFPATDEQMQDEANARGDGENPFADDDHSDSQVAKNAAQQEAMGQQKEEADPSEFDNFEMPKKSTPAQEDEDSEEDGSGSGDGEDSEEDSEEDGSGSSDSDEEDGEEEDGSGSDGDEEDSDSNSDSDSDSDSEDGSDSDSDDASGSDSLKSTELKELMDKIREEMEEKIHDEDADQKKRDDKEDKQVNNVDHYKDTGFYDADSSATVQSTPADGHRNSYQYTHYVTSHKGQVNTLVAQMKRLIQSRKPGKVSRRERMGYLDERRVVWADETDRIYKRKKAPKTQNVAVEVVIDESGSMGGDRAAYAAEMACVLSEMMQKLGWDYEVVGFQGHGSRANINVRKGFKDALNDKTKASLSVARAGSCTPAGAAALWARDRLQKFPAEKKIMIMIFDGQPDDSQVLHDAIKNSDSSIGWLGIGIDGCDVSPWFDHNISCNADQLVAVGMNTIRRLTRGL